MSTSAARLGHDRPRRRNLGGLIAVSTGGILFAVLLLLVRSGWAPLESVDHGLAADLNSLVAGHRGLVAVLRVVTTLGSYGILSWLVGLGAVIVLLRRRFRLAAYLVVAGVGAIILDPVLKAAVGRLRPVVADPIAHGQGNSFPSGHALGSIICYGALLLVFLPALPRRARRPVAAGTGVLVVAIGISRIMLGVHFLSDVIGAWGLGVAWLGLTAYTFELWRRGGGQRVTAPLEEGLEPEAAADLKPTTEPHREMSTRLAVAGRAAAMVAVAWVLVFGAVVGLGELVVRYGGANPFGDRTVPHFLAAHRTATLDTVSLFWSNAGNTHAIMTVGLIAGAVALAVIRRWRPVLFLLVLMLGELVLFLACAAIVDRPRPDVSHLDSHLPTSSYPSGHVAATICLYTGVALLVMPRTKGWWRWLSLVPVVVMPALVAASRMYRGMHHPTDVLGSVVLATFWLAAVYLAVRPNMDLDARRAFSRPRGSSAS
ncbi:MAG TPA: phosphatase PAP2 family protein [Rugosimonospora sp.]